MKSVNPYAHQNILDKLLEAVQRRMWISVEDTLAKLRDTYLDVEGEIEAATDG